MIKLSKISDKSSSKQIMKENMLKISKGIIDTVIEKNELYGNALFMLGEKGLFPRVYDKINRLKYLVWDKESKENYTEKEKIAIANAVFDIFGYMLGWIYLFIDEETIDYLEKEIL